jgi:glycogen(starch) synthase
MRLLFISAFYPPYEIGGWEQLTQELVDRLKARGHDIRVLTSNFGLSQSKLTDDSVLRVLELINDQYRYDPLNFFLRRKSNQKHNFLKLKDTLNIFQPQAVMVHSMWNLSRSIPWMVERLLPGRFAYYLADYWPAEPDINVMFWIDQGKRQSIFGWRSLLSHKILNQLKREQEDHRLKFENTVFVSQAVQKSMINSGFEWATRGCVIYNGIDVAKFSPAKPGSMKNSNRYLLTKD